MYFLSTKKICNHSVAIESTQIIKYLILDGAINDVNIVLPIKYSFSETANDFIVSIKAIASETSVMLYNGNVIATSRDTSGTSGVQLKANTNYLFITTNNNIYNVFEI